MFKFVSKFFGFDASRIEFLESECMKQREEIKELFLKNSELKASLNKVQAVDIDYSQIDIDYDVLGDNLKAGSIAANIRLDRVAEEIPLDELAENISLDDLCDYIDLDSLAANLNIEEDDFVEKVSEKILEKLVNKYNSSTNK